MDWQSLAWIGFVVVLFVVMMRGCGGMMAGGGCGMGSRRPKPHDEPDVKARQERGGNTGKAA